MEKILSIQIIHEVFSEKDENGFMKIFSFKAKNGFMKMVLLDSSTDAKLVSGI